MTGFGIGHPDWQAYANWRDLLADQQLVTVQPGANDDVGTFVTTNWATLIISMNCDAPGCILEIEWFADTAGTVDVTSDSWAITNNTALYQAIPVKGQLAVISVFNPNGTAIFYDITVQPSNTPVYKTSYLASPQTTADFNHTLTHGASVTYFTSFLVGGPATFTFNPHDALAKLNATIVSMDAGGNNVARLVNLVAPTVTTALTLYVPDAPLEIVVTSIDTTASHVYDVSIVQITQ
jgi:hypothetical protein